MAITPVCTVNNDLPETVPSDLVKYTLYQFNGDVSAGEVYLIVDIETGWILEFNHYEATFE